MGNSTECPPPGETFTRCQSTSGHRFWLDGFDICSAQRSGASIYCLCKPLEADPDIAGVGVIAAFIASAGLTLVATVVCLLFARSNHSHGGTYNIFDSWWRCMISEPLQDANARATTLTNARISHTAFDLVVSLSDTQLVAGLAMLLAALVRLHNGSMSTYHFTMVTNLVWLACDTHLLSLLVVRSFESVKKEVRGSPEGLTVWGVPLSRLMRLVLMAATAGMLLFCCWVSGIGYWFEEYGCPAQCAIAPNALAPNRRFGSPAQWMYVNFVFILTEYPSGMFMMVRPWRIWWMDSVRPEFTVEADAASTRDASRRFHDAGRLSWKTTRPLLRTVWYFFSSEMYSVLLSTAWFILGVYWIWGPEQDRALGHEWMSDAEQAKEDSVTGFGQLVPIVLLLLPILQTIESFEGYQRPSSSGCVNSSS